MKKMTKATWAVVNQTQPPAFQRLVELLTATVGPCVLLTGTPFATEHQDIEVIVGPAYSRRSTWSRISTWLAFTAWASGRLLQAKPEGPILLVSNPPLVPLLGAFFSFVLRSPIVILVWDVYPEAAMRKGALGERSLLARAWRFLQNAAFRRAAAVVTIGKGMAKVIREGAMSGRPWPEVQVIPNWADEAFFRSRETSCVPGAATSGSMQKVTVLYAGNIGDTHDLDGMVQTALRLSDASDVMFRIIGAGAGREVAEEEVRRQGLQNVSFLDPVSWEDFPSLLWSADVGVVSQRRGFEDLSMPSKTYSYLAAGMAVLAFTDPGSDLGQLVIEEGIGAVVGPDDLMGAETFLRNVRSHPELLEQMALKSQKVARERFSEGTAVAAWSRLLSEVIVRSRVKVFVSARTT